MVKTPGQPGNPGTLEIPTDPQTPSHSGSDNYIDLQDKGTTNTTTSEQTKADTIKPAQAKLPQTGEAKASMTWMTIAALFYS